MLISRTLYAYAPTPRDDTDVIETLIRLADSYPRYGFGKLFSLLRRQGYRWNHKRVHRIYRQLKLHLRRKGKKRLPTRNPQPLAVPPQANCCWSVDFMHDSLSSGQRFRTFNVVDDYSHQPPRSPDITGSGQGGGMARVSGKAENGQRAGTDLDPDG